MRSLLCRCNCHEWGPVDKGAVRLADSEWSAIRIDWVQAGTRNCTRPSCEAEQVVLREGTRNIKDVFESGEWRKTDEAELKELGNLPVYRNELELAQLGV